uniref:Uncharacterized protein n=1 Tax=Electrophorus electricus TaxID=8005 RepID=A0A4W4E918_ELEEL
LHHCLPATCFFPCGKSTMCSTAGKMPAIGHPSASYPLLSRHGDCNYDRALVHTRTHTHSQLIKYKYSSLSFVKRHIGAHVHMHMHNFCKQL